MYKIWNINLDLWDHKRNEKIRTKNWPISNKDGKNYPIVVKLKFILPHAYAYF